MNRPYTVTGIWPFPRDMLRHDQAEPATAMDRILIERMSGEFAPGEIGNLVDVAIHLVMEAGEDGRHLPNAKRWESFGWTVSDVPEIDQERDLVEAIRAAHDEALRRSALAKLTPDERRVLGLGE